MAEEPTAARKSFGDIAPQLAEITDKVLFGRSHPVRPAGWPSFTWY